MSTYFDKYHNFINPLAKTTHMLWSVKNISCFVFFILFPVAAFSQVGPMGIGNKNGTPTSAGPQPRLLLWLDGSSAAPFAPQAPVETWQDKSGNGHDFVPSGNVQRPSLRIDGGFSGPKGSFADAPSRPCVRFINKSAHLVCPNFELSGTGYSIYFVIRTAQDNFGLFSYSTPAHDREILLYNDGGIRQQTGPLDRASAIGDLSDDEWNYGGIAWGAEDGDNWEYSKNSAYEGGFSIFDGIAFSDKGEAMIGEINNAAGYPSADNFEGFIAEMIIYEGRLSRPETRLLRTYFWIKYGLNGDSGNWDKFNGNMDSPDGESWGGKYYAPIGIGRETKAPNPGSINEARSAGLVLRVNEDDWTREATYLCAAAAGNSITGLARNTITKDDLSDTPSVTERWTRVWEISGDTTGTEQVYQIAFDFGEGIGGEFPKNVENFVLLHRNSATLGDFSILDIPDTDKSVLDDELVFRVRKQDVLNHGPYYTIGTTDPTSSLTGRVRQTWYAHRSGNWSNPLIWTLDESPAPAHVNPSGTTPNLFDDVVIATGRNVLVDTTLPELGDLKVFGTLDLGSAEQPAFENIGGSGLIRCAQSNFPLGNSAAFADPATGGTLEFYGSGGFALTNDLVVNKLNVNLSSTAAKMTLAADLTTNGRFEVNRGTFIINDNSNNVRTLTSNETVLVKSRGKISVSASGGNTKHRWYFHKDFINNGGEVRFTNRTAADENFDSYNSNEIQHIVTAFFSSDSTNQQLRADGLSYFSRIVIDKGVDMTSVLSISSNDPGNFKLLGSCNFPMQENPFTPAEPFPGNPGNPNSFALINGTAEIGENIFIPLQINRIPPWENGTVGNYNINNTARLWVNGGEVTKGPHGGPDSGGNGLVIYGEVKVSKGVLNVFARSGTMLRDSGVLQVDGGTANSNGLQTSASEFDNLGGLIINGGSVNLNGNFPGGIRNHWHTLSVAYPGNLFKMTGGTLHITGPSNTGLVFINSNHENTRITGGTVHLDISDNRDNHKIASRAPFPNLTLTRSASGDTIVNFRIAEGESGPGDARAELPVNDLIILNNLSISGANYTTLEMGTDSTPADLYLSGNLTIDDGCAYIHNNNTTRFTGNLNSALKFGGSTTFPFYNVEINKETDSQFVAIQETGPETAMEILGNLNFQKGYLINNSRGVIVRGIVINGNRFGYGTNTEMLIMEENPER